MLDQVLIVVSLSVLIIVSPGPDMVIVMRNTLTGGRSAGFLTSLGVLTGNLVHVSYCVLGIGWLISESIVAFTVLKYAAAAYLVYLGISSFRASRLSLTDAARKTLTSDRTWYMQGFVNNILNPKGTLFYLGVFTMVITPDTAAGTTALLVLIMHAVFAAFWVFFVLTLDHPAVRGLFDRFQAWVHRVFGTLLVFLGVRLALLDR